MTPAARTAWLTGLLASAPFARAYTLAALGAVFSSFAIERTAGLVSYVTIIVGLCVLGLGMLLARRREISLLRLVPVSVVLFVAWALASAFWSSDSSETWWNWVALAGIAFLAIVIGHVRDTLQTVRALGDVLRVLLGASLVVEILSGILLDVPFRFLGVQGNIATEGSIQGIFGTRNLLGFVAVMALVTFLIEYRTQSVRVGVSVVSVVLAGALGFFSDSPTVLVLAVGVGAAVAALAWVRHTRAERRGAVQWFLGGVVIIGLVIGYVARHPIVAFLGAGTDFSTRVTLWNTMVDYVRFAPIEGQGWYGPWDDTEWPFNALNYVLNADHASGLNAYLDVLLQLGWVGLLIFLALCSTALVRSWLDASERRSVVYAWTPLMLVTLLIDSMFESFTLSGLGWLMLVLCAVRAGQSRSWRARLRSGEESPGLDPEGLPDLGSEPGPFGAQAG